MALMPGRVTSRSITSTPSRSVMWMALSPVAVRSTRWSRRSAPLNPSRLASSLSTTSTVFRSSAMAAEYTGSVFPLPAAGNP